MISSLSGHAALRRAGPHLLIAVSALLALGFLGIVSGELLDWDNSPTFRSGAFKRLAFVAAGIASGLAFTAFPIQKMRRALPWLYAGSCILLVCCFIPGVGVEIGGSHRWIRIPWVGMRLQPSELAKPAVVLALASLLSSSWFQSRRFVHTTLIPALLVLPPILLVALEVDLGYTTLLVGAVLTLIFLRGVPLCHLCIQSAVGLLAVALGIWSVPNRRSRIEVFLDLDSLTSTSVSGYQQWRSIEALKRASALPTGADSPGVPIPDHLPFAATDFVLPALGETWGIVVCLLVILAYFVAMRAGFSIARFASDSFSRLAASGLLLIVLLQAIINVAVGLALLPVSGMPLPLVSAGGSNLVATFLIMGVLWRIRSEALQSHSLEGIETPPAVSDEVIRLPDPSDENLRVPDREETDPMADSPVLAEEVYVLTVPPNHEPSGRRNRRPS